MMFWKVLDKDNNIVATLHNVEYSGRYMNDRLVLSTLYSDNPIDFNIGDIVVYRGETFVLNSVPSVKKTGRAKYTYSLTFQSYTYELEFCVFRDVVLHDNNLIYANHRQVDFTGDVTYLTDRIQANLDQLYPNKWNIDVNPNIDKKLVRNISAQNSNCWNALTMVNSEYGFNFYIKGRDVFIGYDEPVIDEVFVYGEGNGAYEIERVVKKEDKIITKLSVTGTGRNLDDSYPKKPEWKDSNLPEDFFLSPLTLMIPEFKKDGKTDFVLADEKDIAKYGIREGSVVIDEIYPSITGALNNQGKPIDEIVSVGVIDNEKKHFEVHINNPNFTDNKGNKIPLKELMIPTKSKLVMKDGSLQGFGFFIIQSHEEGNKVRLVLERNSSEGMVGDTQEKFTVPNSSISMSAGDKFVFIDIFMPQNYIAQAEIRLKNRAEEILKESLKPKYSYSINVNNIFVARKKLYEDIMEGQKIHLKDKGLGIDEHILIENINIKEGESMIPDIKIVLNNEPKSSTKDIFKNQISKIEGSVTNSYAALGELNSILRKKLDKSTWDRVWEIKKDSKGKDIIYGKLPVVTKYGITMNAILDDIDVPTLMDAIRVDDDSIKKRADGTLYAPKLGGGTLSEVTINLGSTAYKSVDGVVSLPAYATHLSELKNDVGYITHVALSGLASESWVRSQDYLRKEGDSKLILSGNQFESEFRNDNWILRNKYTGGGWARNLLSIRDAEDNAYINIGGKGSRQLFDYLYIGRVWNDYNISINPNTKITNILGTALYNDEEIATKDWSNNRFALKLHKHNWSDINNTPTTLGDYGITDAVSNVVFVKNDDWNNASGLEFFYNTHTNIQNTPHSTVANQFAISVFEPLGVRGFQLSSGRLNDVELNYRVFAQNGISDWKQVAFTDSNVASATKLQTPRKFWNNYFDGTKDVEGDMHIKGSIYEVNGIQFNSNLNITDGFGENILKTFDYKGGTALSMMEESMILNSEGATINGKVMNIDKVVFKGGGEMWYDTIRDAFVLNKRLLVEGEITMNTDKYA